MKTSFVSSLFTLSLLFALMSIPTADADSGDGFQSGVDLEFGKNTATV
jgi:hypothetical protein